MGEGGPAREQMQQQSPGSAQGQAQQQQQPAPAAADGSKDKGVSNQILEGGDLQGGEQSQQPGVLIQTAWLTLYTMLRLPEAETGLTSLASCAARSVVVKSLS